MRSSLAASFLSEVAANDRWRPHNGAGGYVGDPAAPIGRRGAPRLRLSIPARLVTLTDSPRCILVNLSRTGARIGLQEPLHERAEVILTVAGLDQFGWVVSCEKGPNGGTNGIKFEAPLSDDAVLAMREYAESIEDEENWALRKEVREWVTGTL